MGGTGSRVGRYHPDKKLGEIYRVLKSHALAVRHTHFDRFTRAHATLCISHAEKAMPTKLSWLKAF